MTREIASSTQGDAAPAAARPARRRWRPTIAVALIFGFGLIVLVAVSSVMWVALGTAQKNTVTLLRKPADVAVARLIDQLTIHLGASRSQSEFPAEMIGRGGLGAKERANLAYALLDAPAADPPWAGSRSFSR